MAKLRESLAVLKKSAHYCHVYETRNKKKAKLGVMYMRT